MPHHDDNLNNKDLKLVSNRKFITKDAGEDMGACELVTSYDSNHFFMTDAVTGITKVFKRRDSSDSRNPTLRDSLARVNELNRKRYARQS
jgi:hypothetical protein